MEPLAQKQIRCLTGDRPTGPLHLGHYVGSLKRRLELQNSGAEVFVIIADFQVITDRTDTSRLEENVFDVLLDYLAVGIDPKKTTIFLQSRVPELAELTVYFSNLVTLPQIERNPTVKEELRSAKMKEMTLGLFSYPVSQAADILLFRPDVVPVGEDQLPHIELTREIAARFNVAYGEVFPLPKPELSTTPRLLGLDAGKKMSKSLGNTINLSDSREDILKKIKTAMTDSGREITYDPVTKPALSNLLTIFSVVTGGRRLDSIARDFAGKGYAEFKTALGEAVDAFIAPLRERRAAFAGDRATLVRILREGTYRAREEGMKTMRLVRRANHFEYPGIF